MTVVVTVDVETAADEADRSAVIREAAKIASAFDEELHVVHVLSQSRFREMEQESVEDTGKTIEMDAIREVARDVADEAASGVVEEYTPVGLVGSADDEIVKYAKRQDASYVVLGGKRRSAVGKALFGSVTQSVLLNAPMPVLTVPPEDADA
ncbi:universal stress protein [Halopenitus persicus]|uniref:Nucleotide-binding universal stress protein, UspA family n=1 Tax=Halopenitus persicus TaxID=1048396 RepID=A0A1H3H728_9EURY|nr:universal stress protein [Halopenitus persicus]SDY11286.1 Nucleotide-binding universal stress protein, UspA family [Halopenitus persicus]